MEEINGILTQRFLGIPLQVFLRSALIIAATFVVRNFIATRLMDFFARLAEKTEVTWDDEVIAVSKPQVSMLVIVFGVWSALRILPLPVQPFHFHDGIDLLAKVAIIFIFAALAVKYVAILEGELKKRAADPDYWMDAHLTPVVGIGLKACIAIAVFVVTAQTLGYSVSALVASLGIGGVAVALAAKDTLANFFGSIMVMVDKPFRIGEVIKAKEFTGTVEEVGFRSTRIRTLEKSLLIIPNDKIASMPLENMDRIKDKGARMRRVNFTLGIEYRNNAEKTERVVNALRGILEVHPRVSAEARHVFFEGFGQSSLDIFINYFITTADFPEFMKIRQELNLAFMRKLEELGVSPAFPSRTVYLENPEIPPGPKGNS